MTAPEPATVGSYGEAPGGYRLPAGIELGPVRLQVGDLSRSLDFYRQTLGLRVASKNGSTAQLTADGADAAGSPLIELRERRGARPVPPAGRLGLFHFAILLPDRGSLGRLFVHLSQRGVQPGAADHLVSEALYLRDPDGLGIEVYADRPRDTWRRIDRELVMSTDPLDLRGLAAAANGATWPGMPEGTSMGHLHLHVGDLGIASRFYSEGLGLDRMVWTYPGALFLAASGYHHHLGTNVWAGRWATAPQPDEAQLLEWTLRAPSAASLDDVARSLWSGGFAAEHEGESELVTCDPWGTALRISRH